MKTFTDAELEYLEHLVATCAWIPNDFTEPAKTVGTKLRLEILRRRREANPAAQTAKAIARAARGEP